MLRCTLPLVVALFPAVASPAEATARPASTVALDATGFRQLVAPFLQRHCVECHGPKEPEGDLRLDTVRLADFASGDTVPVWANILERLATGNMPPAERPRPERKATGGVVLWIRDQLLLVGHGAEFAFPDKGNLVPHNMLFDSSADA